MEAPHSREADGLIQISKKEMTLSKTLALSLMVLAGLSTACGKKNETLPAPVDFPTAATAPSAPAALAVGGVTLGNALGSDKRVATSLETFGVKDKIYASVETVGQGHARLRALWSYVKNTQTTKVNDMSMAFDASGPAWNEFHIENNKDWPTGDYQVEIFLNDAATPATTRKFTIR